MTIHILYNKYSRLNNNPKNNLARLKRLHNAFLKAGKDCKMELLQEDGVSDLIYKHQAYIASEIHPRELCWFLIYDDEQPRKYLTEESELIHFEDIIGYFRTRDERRIAREAALLKLLQTSSLAYTL